MPEKLNYYIAEIFKDKIYTAGIVRKHQELIMDAAGFKPLKFKSSFSGQIVLKILRVIQCPKMAFSLPAKSTVYFHFPFLAAVYGLLQKILHWRGIKTIALVIDIDGLRNGDPVMLQQELRALKNFSVIVAHNPAMKTYILSQLPGANVLCIEVFDYNNSHAIAERKLSNQVCFAGNLSKSDFVYELDKITGLQFYLYGEHFINDGKEHPDIFYKGAVEPAALPAMLEGSFGLVWDGPSIDICNDYLRYNNPHKLSLYLTAGLPVIVWSQSAIAGFVTANNLGFTVNSLKELEFVLQKISIEQFEANCPGILLKINFKSNCLKPC